MSASNPERWISPGPAPDGRDRRALTARGNRLKSKITVGRGGITDAVVAEVRRALTHTDLLKVRIDADTALETNVLAGDLASRVPCHLIRRIGRVALLYRAIQDAEHDEIEGRGEYQ